MQLKKFFFINFFVWFYEVFSSYNDDTFILQYFLYRNTSHVIGYNCNDPKKNNDLIKRFNKERIFLAINKLYFNASIKPVLYAEFNRIGIFLDLRCHSINASEYIFTKASYARLYDGLRNWLVIGNELERTVEVLNDTEYTITTDLVLAIKDDNDTSEKFSLFDVFNHCKYRGTELNVTFYGTWTPDTGLMVNLTQGKFPRRQNLNGLVLRLSAIIVNRPPNMPVHDYLEDSTIRKQDVHAKFAYALWLHLANLYNFTIEPEQLVALNQSNRQGPVIKKLMERTTEISGSPGVPTRERVTIIDSVPIWPFRACFLFRTLPAKRIKVNHFLKPLSIESWYSMIVITFLVIFVFSVSLAPQNTTGLHNIYSDAFVTTIGCVCQQGSELPINKIPSRIVLLQTMIFSLLLYNYYSASIVSARLSEPLEKINDSLNELAKLSNFKYGAEKSLFFQSYITNKDWEAQQFYNNRWIKVPEQERFPTPYEGMKRVKGGYYAYHVDVNIGYPLIERYFDNQQTCQLTQVFLVRPHDFGIFLARNGSFTEFARVGFARLRESGLRARQIGKWTARAPQCRSDVLNMDPVTIYEAAPAFLLLCFGLFVAFFICNAENMIMFKQKFTKKQIKRFK